MPARVRFLAASTSQVFLIGGLLLLTARDAVAQPAQVVQVVFLNVGQGDAILVRAPEGQSALIDAGPAAPLEALRELGVTQIDLLVATHPHADHIGGMVDVLNTIPVRFYMDNGEPYTTAIRGARAHARASH